MKSVFMQIGLEYLILGAQIIKNTKILMCLFLKIYLYFLLFYIKFSCTYIEFFLYQSLCSFVVNAQILTGFSLW